MYYESKFISQSPMQKPRSTMWSVGGFCSIVFLVYFVHLSDGVPLTYKDVSEFEVASTSTGDAKGSIEFKESGEAVDHDDALSRNKRHFDYLEYGLESSEENHFGYFNKPSYHNYGSYPSSSGFGFWQGGPHHYRQRPQYKPHHPHKQCKFPFSHSEEREGPFDFGKTTTPKNEPKPPTDIPSMVPPVNIPSMVPPINIPSRIPPIDIPSSVPPTTIVTTTTEDIPEIDIRSDLEKIRRKRDEVSVDDIEDQESDFEFPRRPLFVSKGVTESPVALPLDVGISDAPTVEEEKAPTTETTSEYFVAPDVTRIEEGNASTNDTSEYSIVPAVSYDYYDPSLRRQISIHHAPNDYQSNNNQYYGHRQFPNHHRYPFYHGHHYHPYPPPYSHGHNHHYYPRLRPPYGSYPTPHPFSQHGYPFIPSNTHTCTDKNAHQDDDFNDDSGIYGKIQDVFESSTEYAEHVSLPIDVRTLKNFN